MNNMIWDAVVWLRKKLKGDKEDIIQAVNNIQNLFETSADATASADDILEGQTAYNGTVLINGTMKDRRGVTVTTDAVTQDENYTYLSIPEEACYGVNSKVRTQNSNITPNLKICGIAQPGGAPVTVPKAGCYIVYMSAQSGREPAQPENTEIICEPTYFSVATIGVYLAVYVSTDVTSVACAGSNYNYVQGAIVLAP